MFISQLICEHCLNLDIDFCPDIVSTDGDDTAWVVVDAGLLGLI